MTRQEAVERLKSIKSLVDKYDDVVALREAIKALEQEPCEDAISRQAVIDALTKTSGIRGDALKVLYDLPPVTPKAEPCEDAISRQAAIDALNQSINILEATDRIADLPSVTPKQSNLVLCKDCKYFEHGEIAEICDKWGLGCVTEANGWCFLAEKKEEKP